MANYPNFKLFTLIDESAAVPLMQAHICRDGHLFAYGAAVCSRCHHNTSVSFFLPETEFEKLKLLFDINVKTNQSTDQLKEGDFIICKRTVGLTRQNNSLTEGNKYQIINLWRNEDGSLKRIFVINNNGKKSSYDVNNSFHRNWSLT